MVMMRMLFMVLLVLFTNTAFTKEVTHANILVTTLLTNYNRDVRPVKNYSDVIHVQFKSELYNIVEVNEAREQLTFTQWVKFIWNDYALQWSPDDYDKIDSISIHLTRIWQPDIVIVQQVGIYYPLAPNKMLAQVQYDGTVIAYWPQVVTIHCPLDVGNFPYDHQKCLVTSTSWTYEASKLQLTESLEVLDENVFQLNPEWDLVHQNTSSRLFPYVDSYFYYEVFNEIHLRRKPMYYLITLVTPSFAITMLCLLGLFSPSCADQTREEKVSIGLTALLTIAVLLLMVSEQMPKSSHFPRLGTFIIVEMLVTFSFTLLQACLMFIHGMGAFDHKVPKWLLRIVMLQVDTNISNSSNDENWKLGNEATYYKPRRASIRPITETMSEHEAKLKREIFSCVQLLTEMMSNIQNFTKSDNLKINQWTRVTLSS